MPAVIKYTVKPTFRDVAGRWEKATRLGRMLRSMYMGYCDSFATAEQLRINPECRSYHLGWMLYAFAGRTDFNAIVNHPNFSINKQE